MASVQETPKKPFKLASIDPNDLRQLRYLLENHKIRSLDVLILELSKRTSYPEMDIQEKLNRYIWDQTT